MLGFIKSVFRPIASIGRKMGEIFGVGRKIVQEERVIERGGRMANVGSDFVDIPIFEKRGGMTYLRGADEMVKGGGFKGMM